MSDVVAVVESPHSFAETLSRLIHQIKAHGATVFAVIDHAEGAVAAGLQMPPTTVVVFGNPAVGTPLMLQAPDLALDLPSRALVRQVGPRVEVAYTNPEALAVRHGLPSDRVVGLSGLTKIIEDALSR